MKFTENHSISNPISINNCSEKKTEFILEDYLPLPQGSASLLIGKGGEGKSLISVYLGLNFVKQNPGKKAFLWLSEDSSGITKYRANQIGKTLDIEENHYSRLFISESDPFCFLKQRANNQKPSINPDLSLLKTELEDFDFIVLDPLSHFFGGDENNNSQARLFMKEINKWAQQENKTILLIHHLAKSSKDHPEKQARGAGDFLNSSRVVYLVEKANRSFDGFKFTLVKDNYFAEQFLGKEFNHSQPSFNGVCNEHYSY